MPKIFKRVNPQLISSFVLLVITGALLLTCAFTFAWFSSNEKAAANGMQIGVADERITLSDTIVVTRTMASNVTIQTYRCEGEDAYYYLYENDAFLADKNGDRIPLVISDLLPGETVEVSFAYTCTDSLIGKAISAKLTDISSDTFTEIGYPDVPHYVLGVYKFAAKQGGDYPAEEWVVEYASGVAEEFPESLPLFIDTPWSKISDVPQDNYAVASFRFEFDLEQYNMLQTTTNLLSEKSFSIGELRIEVTRNE